jgi:N-acetylmuramoyl-L-alanine amidase
MTRRFHWTAAVVFLLPLVAAPKSGIIQVTGLRSWSHPGSTRVILETSGPAEYHADRAVGPDRLFLDIPHARPWLEGRRVALRQINDQLVKRVRIAETSPGTTRIVFDLAGAAEYKVSRLESPDRLVIELTATRKQGQLAAAPPILSHALTATAAVAPMPNGPLANPPVSRLTARARSGVRRDFTPPVLPRPAVPVVPVPGAPPVLELAALAPVSLPDAWVSLAYVKLPRKAAAAATTATPAPFVNTTTRVLPAVRPSGLNRTAKESTDASLSLTRALGLKINRIVIDAGHGGHDDGTIGPNGVLEKDVVLDVALRLSTLLQTRLGAEVVLTRSDDTFVPLTERTSIANAYKADLFLSIHANSSPAPAVAGTETFLLNLNSSPGAITVAARENAGADKSVGELRDLVQSIALNDKIAESQTFAASIQSSIFTQAAKGNVAAHDRGVKKAPFVVLIGARMPSVLAEIGFLSNPKDESNLNRGDYRQKIAESLYLGIARYAQSLSHFEVAGTSPAASVYSGAGTR